ncbi:divergent protein kinase domain 2A-like [Anneissia japonica]|uniref:divergent protein kinase domain 2A-like n=1 Tax=Anneissia japonica TaxID=1529436 RepID=UPI0014259E45|nr:divergent protein kinase domain 2A-like [Anneissia japonica]
MVNFLPAFYGVCGRGFVIGNDGLPLYKFLLSPWKTRVRLAIQLLDLIDHLINSSSEWELIILKFDFNSFYVTSNGQLVLKNIDDLVIIDKTQTNADEYEPPVSACNDKCLSEIFELKSLCKEPTFRPYSHVMFLIACTNILSDENDRKEEQDKNIEGMGLLHDPVGQQSHYVSEFLTRCIHEESFGARIATVKKFRHILKQML